MTELGLDAARPRSWIGRSTEAVDRIAPGLVERYCATFDLPVPTTPGAAAPPGLHWCLSPQVAPTAALGADGHPERGGFLPPIPLPRRMWAGGELVVHRALRVGDDVRRRSVIEDVAVKQGRTGPLCFVVVRHTSAVEDEPAIVERQDIVFRGPELARATAPEAGEASAPAQFTRTLVPTPVLLFRYSALTFNGHRIHFDRRYCREEEGYPALVVHGPLQASLLLQFALALRDGVWPRRFSFRSTAPLFDDSDLTLNANTSGAGLTLWTAAPGARPAMQAEAEWNER